MPNLHLDFETRSKSDLTKVGAFKYVEDPTTDILCLCYAIDDGQIATWQPGMLGHLPLLEAISKPDVKLRAWNATFDLLVWEHVMVKKYGWPHLPDGLWYDTMAKAVSLGYPASLDKAAPAMVMTKQKLDTGTRLINMFSKPSANGDFIDPLDRVEDFRLLIRYCTRDVEVERSIYQQIGDLSADERKVWLNTLKINRRGIHIDAAACRNIIAHIENKKSKLNDGIAMFTGNKITTVTQRERIKNYLLEEYGFPMPDMRGVTIDAALDTMKQMPPERQAQLSGARLLLTWHKRGSLSSVAKYQKMLNHLCHDRTIKGFLFYHGAGTGRYSGRGVQLQNFPNKTIDRADEVIDCLHEPDTDIVELMIGDIFKASKQLLRAMLIAPSGKYMFVADYKSIEAVGSAWACSEIEILLGFRKGLDQYKLMASKMYKVPYEQVTSEQRFAGKIAVLACGYGGGATAILSMSEKMRMDVSPTQAFEWTNQFRTARPALVQAWQETEQVAKRVICSDKIKEGAVVPVNAVRGLSFRRIGVDLRMVLPSGREINYPEALLHSEIYESDPALFGLGDGEEPPPRHKHVKEIAASWVDSKTHNWAVRKLYGSLLFQNYIQGLCRDILTAAQLRLEEAGLPITINVHDELGGLVSSNDEHTYNRLRSVMTQRPAWLDTDFPILADGYIAKRYRK